MRSLLLVLLAVAACRPGGVHSEEGQPLRATPGQLSFDRAWVGYPASQTVTVFNPNRAPVSVTAAAQAPFSVSAGGFELGGGASTDLTVMFLATAPGHASGTLALGSVSVPLEADASPVPDCGAPKDCQTLAFDPDAGACASHPIADGTSCATPYNCFTAAVCRGGECRGTTNNCDDHNPCTLDVCGATGCGHLDGVTSCPPPTDPCQAPVCDLDAGCGFAPVPDGFACGPRDCTSAKICVNAQCVSRPVPQNQACVEVIAGAPGGTGTADGVGQLARFRYVRAMTFDPAGNLYVADGSAIRGVTATGVVTTLAGSVVETGYADGFGPAARFDIINHLVWFGGNLIVEDDCSLRQVSPLGVVSTWVGQPKDCRAVDGIGMAARLNGGALAATSSGTLMMLDPTHPYFEADAGVPLREVSAIGEVITKDTYDFAAMFGVDNFFGRVGNLLETPGGLAGCGASLEGGGGAIDSWWFELGADGGAAIARMSDICESVVYDGTQALVTRQSNIDRRLPDGGWTTYAGSGLGSRDGPVATASFRETTSLAVGPSGELAIADFNNANIRVLRQGVVSTLAGPVPDRRQVDGPGATARFGYPWKVAAGADHDAWVLDDKLVRHVDSSGAVSTIAGTESCSWDIDGPGPQACFYQPDCLMFDPPDVLLVGDSRLRLVQLPSGYTTSWPAYGEWISGLAKNDGQLAAIILGHAVLAYPDGGTVPLSPSNVYVGRIAAFGSGFVVGTDCALAALSLDGGWTQLTGDGGCGSVDGPIANAQIQSASDLGSDGTTIYMIDGTSNRIRRIANGQVDTVIDLADRPLGLTVEDGGTVLVLVDSAVLRVRP